MIAYFKSLLFYLLYPHLFSWLTLIILACPQQQSYLVNPARSFLPLNVFS